MFVMIVNFGCGDDSTIPSTTTNSVSPQAAPQTPAEKRLALDKELYYDSTLMLGGVSAFAQATGENASELASVNGARFDKEHSVSERRMEEVTKEGEKNNWPDGYDIGAGIERNKLRDQGYRFPGDL